MNIATKMNTTACYHCGDKCLEEFWHFMNLSIAMVYMFSFGMGTAPMLLVLMFAGQLVSLNWRKRMFSAMSYFAVIIGLLFIVQG